MVSTFIEVHLTSSNIEHYQPDAPAGQSLPDALLNQRINVSAELSHVHVGEYDGGRLLRVLLAPVCWRCSSLEVSALVPDEAGAHRSVCTGCAGAGMVPVSEYFAARGVPFVFYDVSETAGAAAEYDIRREAQKLMTQVEQDAAVTAFLDPVERLRWLEQHSSSPASFVTLIGGLIRHEQLEGCEDVLRTALEPHRDMFKMFAAVPSLAAMPTYKAILSLSGS